jgi:nitroreductase
MIEELIRKTRSVRRFVEDPVKKETMFSLIDLARLSASGANFQPLKYIISCEKSTNEIIFPKLAWAGYLKEWSGPAEGERPSAYIIVLGDRNIAKSYGCDHGIATQNILLGATSIGLGCCIIGSVDRKGLMDELKIPDNLEILHVIAMGKPGEDIIVETVGQDGDVKYWRDEKGVHHVPKRALEDIVIKLDERG